MDASDVPAARLAAVALELVEARIEEVPSAAKLADALGLTAREQDRMVRRWIEGETEPSYTNTLRLLTFVGLLPDRLPHRTEGEPWGVAGASMPAARAVDQDVVAQAIEHLNAALERLLALASEQAPPRAAATARRSSPHRRRQPKG